MSPQCVFEKKHEETDGLAVSMPVALAEDRGSAPGTQEDGKHEELNANNGSSGC